MNIKHGVGYYKAEVNVHQEMSPTVSVEKKIKKSGFFTFFLKIIKVECLFLHFIFSFI